MTGSWVETRRVFGEAAQWFAATTRLVGERWTDPGLGEWDVRALVGHTSRSLLTVEAYLARPAAGADIGSAADYYRATRAIAAGPDVAQRGRDAGRALGEDPAGAVEEIVARVVPFVTEREGGGEPITTIAGGMRLVDYLATRTLELVVHTLDLRAALGLGLDVPGEAAQAVLGLVAELACDGAQAGTLLLAATGRRPLPVGFSVL